MQVFINFLIIIEINIKVHIEIVENLTKELTVVSLYLITTFGEYFLYFLSSLFYIIQ